MANIERVSQLTFIRKTKDRKALYLCTCGNFKEIITHAVQYKTTLSCGCFLKINRVERAVTHGRSRHPLYKIRNAIISRCYNQKDWAYINYGARGIMVCDEWQDGYERFITWCEANGYKKGLQIDRINNNGNYEPNNCRFVTPQENCCNRRSNHLIELNGITKTLSQWCEIIGVTRGCVTQRLRRRWGIYKAFGVEQLHT